MKKPYTFFVVSFIVALCGLGVVLALHPRNKSHTVKLTWQAPVTAKDPSKLRYNVYRRPMSGGDYVRIATNVDGLIYIDGLVNHGTTYIYMVRTVDENKRESKNSIETTAAVP